MGVEWPDPRFTDNGDETVTDNLTGLMWSKDAQLISGERSFQDALSSCNELEFADYTDWRLPNMRELLSLIDYGNKWPALASDHPFLNVVSWNYQSSTSSQLGDYFWIVGFHYGHTGFIANMPASVWCCRGRQ